MTTLSLAVMQVNFLPTWSSNHSSVSAQAPDVGEESDGDDSDCTSQILGLPVWYKYLELDANCEVVGPADENGQFDWEQAAGFVALAVFEILLRLGGIVAVGFVIYGGFRFITSQGEPENAASARQTVLNAIIGLVITIISASVVSFIASRLTS